MKQEQDQKYMHLDRMFICIGIVELIIAVIAAAGMGVNVLATTHGVANITLTDTQAVIDHYYADLTMTTSNYHFTGHRGSAGGANNDSATYTYKQQYQDNCGTSAPTKSSTTDCKARYAVWKWTAAYTGLGTAAIIIVFITGVFLFFWGCCAERLIECCCSRWTLCKCCNCTMEFVLMVLNFLVFILFAFSWAIILAIKFDKNLAHVLDTAANDALNKNKSIETYHFDFQPLMVGKSLGPLAAASGLALIVWMYLMVTMCCQCCCYKSNKEEENKNRENKKLKEGSTEMASDEVQV